MTADKKLDPDIMAQLTRSETFYRYGLAGDVLFTEGIKYVVDTAGDYWLLDIICIANVYQTKSEQRNSSCGYFQFWTTPLAS
jgi:hypothetical protein